MSEGNTDLPPFVGKGVLDTEAIKALLGKGRAKNTYGPKLKIFVEGDDLAIDPKEFWALDFGAKEVSTIYQGFNTAIKKAELEGKIVVKQSDGKVFLMHMEKINSKFYADADADEDEDDSDESAPEIDEDEASNDDADAEGDTVASNGNLDADRIAVDAFAE